MSNVTIHPSTLSGIKRLAKSIKRARNITHAAALDESARAARFQNYRHALKTLSIPGLTIGATGLPLYITAYWRDLKSGEAGRETLRISLSAAWEDLVSRAELKRHRGTMHFRGDALDHLERIEDARSQHAARDVICYVARVMQFINATRLRPSRRRCREFENTKESLPGQDHGSTWTNEAGQLVVLDEPYANAVASISSERADWATRNGFRTKLARWPGLYFPGASLMQLFTSASAGVSLDLLIEKIDALSEPVDVEHWTGESAPYYPTFVSPGRENMPTRKRERRDPINAMRPYGNSIGFGSPSARPLRRPNARMPIEIHEEIGTLLKGICKLSYTQPGVHHRLESVRGTLDGWLQREYGHADLPNERFFKVYFGGDAPRLERWLSENTKASLLADLEKIPPRLREHYPNCAPLRKVLRDIEQARKSLGSREPIRDTIGVI